ncbi:hypothetical protein A8F94_08865 [Bacillus sp. FJAT-27225]|uniref:hypothetical protein n=1 Tax=Bacillus sp. FJAT-27225 TaxID=1743144 RepID=UPI00080C34A7|nr:hypothetical protein [Bacillus sp. FJAT-27225]OCA87930.1 hypothetical protein A8F94_08865 [Bacillus sp. FJAT-27225]
MKTKAKVLIGLIGSLLICLFGVYRLLNEIPEDVQLLVIPIVFAVSGSIGVIGNVMTLRKINHTSN